jgi:hypothetical protein
LKYGEGGVSYLSGRGGNNKKRYIPDGIYVTMFSGMQEPDQYLTSRQSRQGLLRRMNIAFVKPTDMNMKDWLPPIDFGRVSVLPDLDKFADTLAAEAIRLYNTRSEKVVTDNPNDPDIIVPAYFLEFPQLNKIAREHDAKLVETDDVSDFDIYRQGTVEQLAELSTIYAIGARRSFGTTGIIITENDFEHAQALHAEIHKHAEEAISVVEAGSAVAKTDRNDLNRIYRIVLRGGREGITATAMYGKASLNITTLAMLRSTLLLSEKIFTVVLASTGGRQTQRFYASELFTPEEIEKMREKSMV